MSQENIKVTVTYFQFHLNWYIILQWMPIEEYVNQPWNKKNEMFKFMANICQKKCEEEYLGFSIVPTTTSSGKVSFIYCNADHANRLKATRDQASPSL